MYRDYVSPPTLDEALALKAEQGANARCIAGGTDLLLEIERGLRTTPHGHGLSLIDLTRVPGLSDIIETPGWIHLGALVTHNQCVAHPGIVANAFALARACWEVGAPQIRNRATVAGNVITASPANDAIVPLLALDAVVTLQSAARGTRTLSLADFITGFRQVDLANDEIVTRISFPTPPAGTESTFIKLGLRRAQAISVVSVAAVITRDGEQVTAARLSLGAVAPRVVRAQAAESSLMGQSLSDRVIDAAAALAMDAATPIDDLRASAAYRHAMVRTLTGRALRQLRDGRARQGWPEKPVLLWGESDGRWPRQWPTNSVEGDAKTSGAREDDTMPDADQPAMVNGAPMHLPGRMSLLDSLRAVGLVGVKEGCAEGECGACTVFLDGMAVMACLIPAERAAGSDVVTVEGLGNAEQLHPVQAALVGSGGVQCGYCTPGFVMSAAKLLEERSQPTYAAAQEALTGNLCRCTGYRKILDAVVAAGAGVPQGTISTGMPK